MKEYLFIGSVARHKKMLRCLFGIRLRVAVVFSVGLVKPKRNEGKHNKVHQIPEWKYKCTAVDLFKSI